MTVPRIPTGEIRIISYFKDRYSIQIHDQNCNKLLVSVVNISHKQSSVLQEIFNESELTYYTTHGTPHQKQQ